MKISILYPPLPPSYDVDDFPFYTTTTKCVLCVLTALRLVRRSSNEFEFVEVVLLLSVLLHLEQSSFVLWVSEQVQMHFAVRWGVRQQAATFGASSVGERAAMRAGMWPTEQP